MYLWTKNCLDMRLKLKAYGKFGGFVHFPDVKSYQNNDSTDSGYG